MNRQKLFALCAALLCTGVIAACGGGGGGQPPSGFHVMGRKWVQVAGGGVRFVSPTSIEGQWIQNNGNAVGSVTSFGPLLCGGPCPVANARVPARWNIVAGLPGGECIGYLTPNVRDVAAGSTQYSECLTFGVVFPVNMSPSSIDLQAPPATFQMYGKGIGRIDGTPFIEYVDEYTGRVIGSTTATMVSAEGGWLQANMHNLSAVFSGTYAVLVSNIRPDGSRVYVGTTTVECFGRDGDYEPPPDPGPCGCPPNQNMACLPCGPQY